MSPGIHVSRWEELYPGDKPRGGSGCKFPDVPKNKMDEFMSETMNLWKGKSKAIGEVMESDDKYLVNPWLRRTGWADYLAGRDVE